MSKSKENKSRGRRRARETETKTAGGKVPERGISNDGNYTAGPNCLVRRQQRNDSDFEESRASGSYKTHWHSQVVLTLGSDASNSCSQIYQNRRSISRHFYEGITIPGVRQALDKNQRRCLTHDYGKDNLMIVEEGTVGR